MFGEADLRRAVARYLAKREAMERDVVFVHLPDGASGQTDCRRVPRNCAASRPTSLKTTRPVIHSLSRPVDRTARPMASRVSVRRGAPHFIIWSRDRVLQVELKTTRTRLLGAERAFGNALNALGHAYHVVRAETPRHAVELVEELLA